MSKLRGVLLGVLMLIGSIPMAGVSAQTENYDADGFVFLISGKNAIEDDGEILITPENGFFEFDVEMYNVKGEPQDFQEIHFQLLSMDGLTSGEYSPDADFSDHVLVRLSGTNDGDNHFTARVPTAGLGFLAAMPGNGVVFNTWVETDGNGDNIRDDPDFIASNEADHYYPGASYNPGTKAAAQAGDWQTADEMDHVLVPILLFNNDSDDLVEPGVATLNPDFALGGENLNPTSLLVEEFPEAGQSPAPTATPPWHLEYIPGSSGRDLAVPVSTTDHTMAGRGGSLQINVDAADFGGPGSERLQLVQNVGDYYGTSPVNWVEPETLEVRLRSSADVDLDVGITYETTSGVGADHDVQVVDWKVDGETGWHTLTVDLTGNNPDADVTATCSDGNNNNGDGDCLAPIAQVYLNIVGETDEDFVLEVDSFRVFGAELLGQELRNDLNDGYAVFIDPMGVQTGIDEDGQVQIGRLTTAAGERYIFRSEVRDTVRDETVDLTGTGTSFQLGRNSGGLGSAADGAEFISVEGDYALAVVDTGAAEAMPGSNAWFFADIESPYTDIFGIQEHPASGYFSVLKNQARRLAIADQLDYAVTPVLFSGETVGEFSFQAGITDIVDNGATGFDVEVSTEAPVFETVNVVFDDGTTKTAVPVTIGADNPGVATFTTTLPTSGASLTVEPGEFNLGTQIQFGPPNVEIAEIATGLLDGVATSLSTTPGGFIDADLNSCIVEASWTFTETTKELSDEVELVDLDDSNCLEPTEAAIDYAFLDDGTWDVTLTATDDEGESDSDTVSVTVGNSIPVYAEDGELRVEHPEDAAVGSTGPTTWDALPGRALRILSMAEDASPLGELTATVTVESQGLVAVPQSNGTFAEESFLVEGEADTSTGQYIVTLPSPGVYDVTVTWEDDHGAAVAEGPLTGTITVTEAPIVQDISAISPSFQGEAVNGLPVLVEDGTATGEDVNLFAILTLTGDRISEDVELVLRDAAGDVVASAAAPDSEILSTDGTIQRLLWSLDATIATVGTHSFGFEGTTFNGADLGTELAKNSFEAVANTAPEAELLADAAPSSDGNVYVEVGESFDLVAEASDADCETDGPRCALGFSWDLDGDGTFGDSTEAQVTVTPETSSTEAQTVSVQVTDHLGAVTEASFEFFVDDHITVDKSRVSQATFTYKNSQDDIIHVVPFPQGMSNGLTVQLDIVDDLGLPVDGQFLWSLTYSPTVLTESQGASVELQSPVTSTPDAGEAFTDGIIEIDLDGTFADSTNLAGLYTFTVTVNADEGRVDRPDEGPTEESLETQVKVFFGPPMSPFLEP